MRSIDCSIRERSAENVVDEIEDCLALGYERISFADDVFTLNGRRVLAICAEIRRRRSNIRQIQPQADRQAA